MAERTVWSWTAMALAAGLGLAAATPATSASENPSNGVYADRVDWGVIIDLSGPTAASQSLWTNGLRDRIRKVNEEGGVGGRRINLLVEDDRFDASLSRVAFDKLNSQTPVLGLSGMGSTGAQVSLLPQIRRGKLAVVGSYTTARAMTEPPIPTFYGGFCGYKEMAQVSVGFLSEKLKLKEPKVATIHLDTAGGKEYADYIAGALAGTGGTAKGIPIKVTAADATPQVLEIINMKPDFVAVHGVATTPILLLRAMQQYGLNIPVIGMAYIGVPVVYSSLPQEAGSNYYFVSCFSPASSDDAPGVKEMASFADKYGRGGMKDDINYVAGWVIGQLISEAIAKAGPDLSREKIVDMMNKGFSIDTKGVSAPVAYTPTDHAGLVLLRPFNYDYATKQFKAFGSYEDYRKFVK